MSSGAQLMPTNDRGPNARLTLGPEHVAAHIEAGYRPAVRLVVAEKTSPEVR
jgi:hypothetical protein